MANQPDSNNPFKFKNLLDAVTQLKTPIQLVGFLIVIISAYWIKEFHGLQSTQGMVLLIFTISIVLAVVFLFYINELSDGSRLIMMLVIYVGILGFLIYIITMFTSSTKQSGSAYYTLKIRDSVGNYFSDFKEITINISEGINTNAGFKNFDHSQFSFEMKEPKPWKIKFHISPNQYRFPNGKAEWSLKTSTDDTTIVLHKTIAQTTYTEKVTVQENSFYISDGYSDHTENASATNSK